MANRILATNCQKLPKFRNFGLFVQNYSSHGGNRRNTYIEQILFGQTGEKEGRTIWPDPNLGCLGAKDRRMSLPGNIGMEVPIQQNNEPPHQDHIKISKKAIEGEMAFWRDLCDSPTSHQRQINTIAHHEQIEKINEDEMAARLQLIQRDKLDLECIPQSCPDLLRREMMPMFGSASLGCGSLTVITICQRTKNDMTSWSPEVEDERDILVDYFVNTAKSMCKDLRSRAQWADFIDPSSGRPFYDAKYTNLTFFETDERYRHLGFRVVDLGCCKVISHQKWGAHAFVGSVFTTAPYDSDYLEQILQNYNRRTNST